ncbi:MAG: hypothetical protein WBD40_17620 [Tepidisphaeraceae bacterium]
MAAKGFLPDTDAGLLAWSSNFLELITATPTAFGLVAADATAYGLVHTSYATALAACEPGVRNRTAVAAKNSARAALRNSARFLAKRVEGMASVTDAQKIELGLNVRAQPVSAPPPAIAPDLDVMSVIANLVKVRIHDATTTLRRKPAGVLGANVFSYVGPTPPAETSAWKFEGGTTRTTIDIAFDAELAPGTKVWITAQWFNRKAITGPACSPAGAVLQFGGNLPLAA